MGWQAVDALHFALATGTGPQSVPGRAGPERAGLSVITDDALLLHPPAPATAKNVEAVRRALAGWGVTVVVIPDPAVLVPHYDRSNGTANALGLFTVAIGRRPSFVDDAWVWNQVQRPGPRIPVPVPAVVRCATEPLLRRGAEEVPDCVIAASRQN
jgi:hypothetical protein